MLLYNCIVSIQEQLARRRRHNICHPEARGKKEAPLIDWLCLSGVLTHMGNMYRTHAVNIECTGGWRDQLLHPRTTGSSPSTFHIAPTAANPHARLRATRGT